jgi:hypothetical protein
MQQAGLQTLSHLRTKGFPESLFFFIRLTVAHGMSKSLQVSAFMSIFEPEVSVGECSACQVAVAMAPRVSDHQTRMDSAEERNRGLSRHKTNVHWQHWAHDGIH